MKNFFLLVATLFFISFLTACPEEKKPADGNKPNPGQKAQNTAKLLTPDQTKQAINLKPKAETKNAAPVSPPRAVADTSNLFALSPQARIMMDDFKIGTLQDFLRGQNEMIAATSVVSDFLANLSRKQIKEELIKEEMRKEIDRSLRYPLNRDLIPENYRIGKAFMEDNEITVNVRLYRGQNITEGEVYLEKENGEWLISDMQIGFTLLEEKYKKEEEPFSPSSYKWLLKDYME
jgi:hypothetical protein